MHGVTTALVLFLFACVIFPHLVKNKPQYYAAFAAICLIVLLDAIGMAVSPTEIAKFRVFAYAACALLQIIAMLLLFLSSGGLSWRELAGDMKEAIEVIRRGGEEKEIIIPLSQQMAELKARRQATAPGRAVSDAPSEKIELHDPPSATKSDQGGGIPLA